MNNMMDLANYIIQRALEQGNPITNLHLQKILYFVFRDAIQVGNNIDDLREIYDENFLVWRYGPVVESVYEEYRPYGSMPIDRAAQAPLRTYHELDEFIDRNMDRNVFSLVNESHTHPQWQNNSDAIVVGRSNVPYSFEDLSNV